MESQSKRAIFAMLLCVVVLLGWTRLMDWYYPHKPAPASSAPTSSGPVADNNAATPPVVQGEPTKADVAPGVPKASDTTGLAVKQGSSGEAVVLGDDRHDDKKAGFRNPYEMAVAVTPTGGGVESIKLSRHRNDVPRDKSKPVHDPYDLLRPIKNPKTNGNEISFLTRQILFVDDGQTVRLDDSSWSLEKQSDEKGETAIATAVIQRIGKDVFKLTKTYRLEKGSHELGMSLEALNLGDKPRKIVITEGGPVGMKNEDPQRETRRIITAVYDPKGKLVDGPVLLRDEVFKSEGGVKELLPEPDHRFLWTAIGNKYFACIVSAQPLPGEKQPSYLGKMTARTFLDDPNSSDDLTMDEALCPVAPIAPGQALTLRLDAFCGPKSDALFDTLPQAKERAYTIIANADRSGCTFNVLQVAMLWLLTKLHGLVRNYGLAIIGLTFIVRFILHPVTKRGQINMMKMQKGMAQLKPKIDLLQEQYKNDKQKLNEETMKLYREEGVNPAGQMLGCLPMFLQMPVWVALWTTLNTNVDLRHQAFFGWINDLSAPDALIPFPPAWQFTIPLIGMMMGGAVRGFNLLPIIMTATMYGQQKLTQKLTQPATPPPPKLDAQGHPIPDPMAQQQKMMSFMMIFFGLMFYNFPSGLNLYILSSNILGMVEQWRIRKHIREKEARGELLPVKPKAPSGSNGKPSFIDRLQKMAENARQTQSGKQEDKAEKKRKERRF
jgi:YidC/Oxa1 family membrane protein insertase